MTLTTDRTELYETLNDYEKAAVDEIASYTRWRLRSASILAANDYRIENLVGAIARYIVDSRSPDTSEIPVMGDYVEVRLGGGCIRGFFRGWFEEQDKSWAVIATNGPDGHTTIRVPLDVVSLVND